MDMVLEVVYMADKYHRHIAGDMVYMVGLDTLVEVDQLVEVLKWEMIVQ